MSCPSMKINYNILLVLFCLSLLPFTAFSQADSLFLDMNMNEVRAGQSFDYILIYKDGIRKKVVGIVEIRDKSGQLIESVNYKKGLQDGDYYKLDINTNFEYRGAYKKGIKTGKWLLRDQLGNMIFEERYTSEGFLKSIESSQKELVDMKIYEEDEAEEPAHYAQGENYWNQYLKQNLRYPREAARAGDQGEVLIELIILPNGVIGQLKDVSPEEIAQSLINESIRVILSAGHWVPAKVNGQPVASIKQVRTVFRLK